MALLAIQPQPQVDTFEQFWDAYPRKRAKGDARKAWAQLRPDAKLVARILDAIDEQRRCKQWREGFIPYPATWLRGERWEDELTRDDFYQARL